MIVSIFHTCSLALLKLLALRSLEAFSSQKSMKNPACFLIISFINYFRVCEATYTKI